MVLSTFAKGRWVQAPKELTLSVLKTLVEVFRRGFPTRRQEVLNAPRRILRATPPAAGPHSRGVGCGVLAVVCWLDWLAGLGWAGDAGKDELGRLARSGWLGLPLYFLLFVWLLFLCFFF